MIDVQHLTFTYPGADRPAVRDVTFSVAPGEILGFLGPSGAGKSTTQNILIGLLRGYEGTVRVFGREVPDWGPAYYERVGVSFERPTHYLKLTALENLRYFASLFAGPTEAPEQLLERVGLGGEGDKRVGAYSKGMRNRLSVARALLHRPDLLFLDEPTAGLDPVGARRIRALIRAERDAGRTVFLTTHDMAVADALCDRVAFIVDGALALVDAPKALKLRHGRRTVRVEFGADGVLDAAEFPLEDLGGNAAFLHLLRTAEIRTIHTQEPSLERIFIDVTGRRLV